MKFLELAESRFSVRKFSDNKIEKEKIDRILRAGQVAPTACNSQPQKVLVLQSDEALEKWTKCTPCHFNEQLVMIVCFDTSVTWKRQYDGQDSGYMDASIVNTHLMLAAADDGIGSCWVMMFDPEKVREEFNLPENLVPVSALPMGYAAADAKPAKLHTDKKPLEETTIYF